MDEGNRVWILLSKQISGSISLDEKIELEELLMHDPEAWYTMEVLDGLKKGEEVPAELVDEIKSLLRERNGAAAGSAETDTSRKRRSLWLRFAGIAAAAAVLVAVTGVLFYDWGQPRSNGSVDSMHEIASPNGSRITHTMPDGTKIRLNAGSKIAYRKTDSLPETREIFLTGEAYFDVVYDARRPFVVQTPDFTIRNLGTSFNVRSYPDEAVVEAALIEGSIEVTLKNGSDKTVIMNPNEKIVVYRDGEVVLHGQRMTEATPVASYEVTPLTIDESSAEVVETAWLHDKIIFKEEPFSALAKKIERQYNVEIQIDNDEIRNQLLTGKFEDEDLEESLSVLQMIVPFNYTIQGNTVKISP